MNNLFYLLNNSKMSDCGKSIQFLKAKKNLFMGDKKVKGIS
ncbi:hypothetical protein PROVRETT_08938 [Providencia rettgeri DSM 1131]|nr:hypothetical protein PROVRETT_08938 [Providencia rettgeri DSM 1131]